MIKYKLTNQKLQTHDGFQWEVGKWYEATGDPSQPLCTDAWLHCYDSPLLAVLHNPIHADIKDPILWEVECDGKTKDDDGLKRGYRRMRLIRKIPLPDITKAQKQRYAILCAKTVYHNEGWNTWADNWLTGLDRTARAARAARATEAAAWAAEAARATEAAAWATEAAAWATRAAWATEAAAWAARAAWAAAWAARAAQAAARAARAAETKIDLVAIAEKAMA